MDSFLTFINQHKPDFNGKRTLLTVSGGVDSVVMVNLFHKMGFEAGIAHCNFGLRGEESEEDELFVRSLAENCGFDFFTKRFDLKAFAKDRSISTQMAAREMRYAWFEEIRKSNNYHWIATAHHANDSFETVLLNLARGTGLAGLHGISAVNNRLIRPLIYSSKEDILKFAVKNELNWREDRSNNTDDYKRNLLRHHVMPVFKKLNPSLETTFKTTSEKLESANHLLNEFMQSWEASVVRRDADVIKINIDKLLGASEPGYRLWFVLDKYGYTYSQVSKILHSIKGIAGKMFLSPAYRLLIDRQELILEKRQSEIAEVSWTIQELQNEFVFEDKILQFLRRDRNSLQEFGKDRSIILTNPQSLIFPLIIRSWRSGDKFQPFGMSGQQKKLSDLFADLKLDRFEKERVRVLVNGNDDIIWVIGMRFDERYKITENCKEIIEIILRYANEHKKI